MAYSQEQIEVQLAKTLAEIHKLYLMSGDTRVEIPGDEEEEMELTGLSYEVAIATFPMYMDNTYMEVEFAAEGLENSWTVDA